MITYTCPKCRRTECWADEAGIKEGEPCPDCQVDLQQLLSRALAEAKAESSRLHELRLEHRSRTAHYLFMGIMIGYLIGWFCYG